MRAIVTSRPAWYVPIASYFTEAHPADAKIAAVNVKTSAEEAASEILRVYPETSVWKPKPGAVFDVGTGQIDESKAAHQRPDYEFEKYTSVIAESLAFPPLQNSSGILDYFRWSGFQDNIILHIIETSEDFEEVIRESWLDLSMPALLDGRPERPHHYERMRVRADVFRDVLRRGAGWEEISIGFQARFYREPDVYKFNFWNHFQNHLPSTPCWPLVATESH